MKLMAIKVLMLTIILSLPNQIRAQKVATFSTRGNELFKKAYCILSNNLNKKQALNGQIIIMDCKSGEIKAMVNLVKDKLEIKSTTSQLSQPTGLMHPISLLAALEQGKVKLNDSIDTKSGIVDINGYLLEDYNWRRGGNGKTTIRQGFLLSSNIATYLTVKQAFGKGYDRFYKTIINMGYGLPQDSIKATLPIPNDDISFAKFVNGKNQQITPLQILAFYNAIANNGKMVKPTFHKGETITIKEQITSKENIAFIQQLLMQKVKDGLAHQAYSDKVSIAGEQGTAIVKKDGNNTIYFLKFCGYYPSYNTQYSIIVSLNKRGLPANGGMAGEIAKQIIEIKY